MQEIQTADVMVHIDDELDTAQREAIESRMREVDGVIAPRFNTAKMLVIYYNVDMIRRASLLLDTVRALGYRAQLIGA